MSNDFSEVNLSSIEAAVEMHDVVSEKYPDLEESLNYRITTQIAINLHKIAESNNFVNYENLFNELRSKLFEHVKSYDLTSRISINDKINFFFIRRGIKIHRRWRKIINLIRKDK